MRYEDINACWCLLSYSTLAWLLCTTCSLGIHKNQWRICRGALSITSISNCSWTLVPEGFRLVGVSWELTDTIEHWCYLTEFTPAGRDKVSWCHLHLALAQQPCWVIYPKSLRTIIYVHLCPSNMKCYYTSGGLILTLSAQSGLMRWPLLALKTSHDGG